ncbi:hypothetical protein [Catenuloplanes japonicus]|uniref:hypothetical protein n=1 Tax=Catenuloplanes japonicus TaxID=33876 RepID=UPI00052574CE|nr:hypothetical protein [Catenuloplanes japonicus]
MGTYLGSATLIASDGNAASVKHASLRTRRDAATGLVTWSGTLDLSDSEITGLLLTTGEGTLRLPDGTEASVQVSAGGTFTGIAFAS